MRFAYRSSRGSAFVVHAGSWRDADAIVGRLQLAGPAIKLGAIHASLVPVILAASPISREAFRAVRDAAWTLSRKNIG
jgi:hypothetical protein